MVNNPIKKFLKKHPWTIRLSRRYSSQRKFFNWKPVLAKNIALWEKALSETKSGQKILVGTCVGGHIASANIESMLAAALTLRGCNVQFLLCDGILKACMGCEIQLNGQIISSSKPISHKLCRICYTPAMRHLAPLKLPVHRIGDYLTAEERIATDRLAQTVPIQEIRTFHLNGIAVGEHAYAGALRFVARGDLETEPRADIILRQYFHASILASYAFQRFFAQNRMDTAVFNHGIYVPQGILGEVCRRLNVKVVNWNPAYRKNCFIFSHEDTYHHTMMSEPIDSWCHIKWSDARAKRLMTYLQSRWKARHDWIWFHEKPNTDLAAIEASTGIDFKKPTIGLLTSVVWDAALHYASNAFPSMLEWLFDTIDYFQKRPDLQLLIRVHPAEIQGGLPSRQRIACEIKKRFPILSGNIHVIAPDSNCSTYAMMLRCNSVIIYNTKTGIELSAFGIPIVVAGEAWVRNKGFTFDAHDSKQYHHILDQLPFEGRMPEDQQLLAQKYAYHFFFRRMISLPFTAKSSGSPPFIMTQQRLSELLPGACEGLDTICDGIMNGRDFINSESAFTCSMRPIDRIGFRQPCSSTSSTSQCK